MNLFDFEEVSIARRIQSSEKYRDWNRRHGFHEEADASQNAIDELKKHLPAKNS